MLAIFSSCFKKFRGLKLAAFIILFCATTIIVRAQGGKGDQGTTELRKELGIPANEMLARQSEQDFLQMLHKDPSIWFVGFKHKNQLPALLEDLSRLSQQQDKVVKLRIQILIFWLKCNFGQLDLAFFQDLLDETSELEQKNLRLNLIILKSIFSVADRPSLLLEKFWEMHEAADILENEPKTEFTNKGLIFLSMGSLFYQVGDMANALKYLKQASGNTSGTHLKLALNTLGFVHRNCRLLA
jgi:tetratricopeptide (TPR) repeat protein